MRSPIAVPQVPSRMKVTCTVARYSAILPSSTAAFSLRTSMPMMPRSVRLARSSALRTASSQLWGDAPITCVMRATAMRSLQQEDELHLHAILGDVPALHLDALARHLEPGDVAQGPGRPGHAFLDGFPEPVGGRRDDLRHPRDCHLVGGSKGPAAAQATSSATLEDDGAGVRVEGCRMPLLLLARRQL